MNTFANYPKSTPTTALEVILDVLPLHLFCMQSALASKSRLKDLTTLTWDGVNSNKTHAVSHLRHWDDQLRKHDIDLTDQDSCLPQHPPRLFKINLDSLDGKTKHRTPAQCNICTDGSKINDSIGCGFATFKKQIEQSSDSFRLDKHGTVFQAELMAIEKACNHLLTDTAIPSFIKIFSDSQAAIKALANSRYISKTVCNTATAMNKLALKTKSLTLVWIPAHRGHHGNERADTLAKFGATSIPAEQTIPTFKPSASIKREITNAVYNEWTTEWHAQEQAHHSKSFYSRPCQRKARFVYKLARLDLGRFVRIITGHNNLNFFQTKIGLWGDPLCRFCGEGNETMMHFLYDCPSFFDSSRAAFPHTLPTNGMEWSVKALLHFSYIPAINLAFEGTLAHGDPADRDDLDSLSTNEREPDLTTDSNQEDTSH